MRPARSVTLLCLAVLAAGALAGDVLVTTDGTVVETKGPWQQRGKMVVFTLPSGQLSSLRAADVDFEATEQWQAELSQSAPSAAAAAAAEAPKATLVLTDKDVARADLYAEPSESVAGPSGEDSTSAGDSTVDPATQSPVRVTAWDEGDPADGRGRTVSGTVRNDGNTFATDVSVEVTVYNNDGAIAGTQTVVPVTTNLGPGESSTFSTQFTEVYVVSATRFRVTSLDLELDDGGEDDLTDAGDVAPEA